MTHTPTSPPDLLPAVYMTANMLAPAYMAVEQGLGPHTVAAAVCAAWWDV